MAARETDRNRREPRDADRGRATPARAEVIEILAGAVLALLLQRSPRPSPDEVPHPEKGSNTATSGQIRGPQ